ncbi:MAG TPA: ornithine cyclodeaminase family protein [Burkholderiaceae bacterium]|nr:ornithine cyclodeaminase family protein [Burkholderiaceae bacterium]
MTGDARLLLLNSHQVGQLMEPDAVLAAVREAFVLHSERLGRVFPVVREPLATGGIFGIKSGDVQSQELLGFKAAGFWPSNRQLGGEPHQATVMLFDPKTGRPLCLIDGNAITTARTGAAGGLGLVHLARPQSKSLCLFGTGVQARVQLSYALRLLPQLEHVRYVSFDDQPDSAFEAHFSARCELRHATDRNAAVAASDVVITATPGAGPLFDRDAVQPGTHLNCVGADTKGKRELPEGLLQVARVVVDDEVQARQIGETQWRPQVLCTEIGDLIAGKQRLDRGPKEITLFDMTGLALQDLTVARMLVARAQAAGMATSIPWPW